VRIPSRLAVYATARAAALLGAARALNREGSVGAVQPLLLRMAEVDDGRARRAGAARIAKAHARVARVGSASCLERSLALWADLRAIGEPVELRVGVSLQDRFRAHAWVELDGVVVNDDDDVATRFVVIAEDLTRALERVNDRRFDGERP
jgi:hypothetical protein